MGQLKYKRSKNLMHDRIQPTINRFTLMVRKNLMYGRIQLIISRFILIVYKKRIIYCECSYVLLVITLIVESVESSRT